MPENNGQEPEIIVLQIAGEIEPNADGGYTVSIGGESFQAADVAEALAMLAEAVTEYEMGYAPIEPGKQRLLDLSAEADGIIQTDQDEYISGMQMT